MINSYAASDLSAEGKDTCDADYEIQGRNLAVIPDVGYTV